MQGKSVLAGLEIVGFSLVNNYTSTVFLDVRCETIPVVDKVFLRVDEPEHLALCRPQIPSVVTLSKESRSTIFCLHVNKAQPLLPL